LHTVFEGLIKLHCFCSRSCYILVTNIPGCPSNSLDEDREFAFLLYSTLRTLFSIVQWPDVVVNFKLKTAWRVPQNKCDIRFILEKSSVCIRLNECRSLSTFIMHFVYSSSCS